MQNLHVVLGASGTIGSAVVDELNSKGLNIRAVERSKQVSGLETMLADLLDPESTFKAIEGATHVYLCVGITYSVKSWRQEWPTVIDNVITACAKHHARLIFFDNVYMYGPEPLPTPFYETNTQQPPSKKGVVRKEISNTLLEAHRSGRVRVLIARSADFYGPNAVNSTMYVSFLERMLKGKNPQSLAEKNTKHTYSYSLDNGRAMVRLALDESAYGQVWHLPVGKAITIERILETMNRQLGSNYKAIYMGKFTVNLISLFSPIVREVKEMLYQFRSDYVMSDQKFRTKYPDFEVTDYDEGIRCMIESFKRK